MAVAWLMLGINGLGQAAEVVGDLGAAYRLVVRGLTTIPCESLRDGLLEDADLYWRGLPSADRAEYLQALQARSTLALKATGFAEPRVTVTTERGDDDTEMIAIDVVEGPRTMMGPIRVTGLPGELAARLDAHLRNEQPPVEAERETFVFPDGTTTTRWRRATGETVRFLEPAWEPEEPANFAHPGQYAIYAHVASFFRHEGYFDLVGLNITDAAEYVARLRERVDVSLVCENGQATLVIDVQGLPPKSVLKAIEISKDLHTASEELQTYLGIEIGKPVSNADRVAWLEKLRDSGRFLSHSVSFKPVTDGVAASFELVEYAPARPLADPPSREEEALRRCREWFMGLWHSGHEIRISATHENHARGEDAPPVELDAVIGRNAGCVGVLRFGEDQYGVSLWHDKVGLYGPAARLTVWLPGGLAPYFTVRSSIALEDEDDVRSRPRGSFALGAAVNSKHGENQLTIEPVCCAYAANTTTSSMDGDVLVIEYEGESDDSPDARRTGTMRIDPVTGQCLGGTDGAWVFTVSTGKGTGAEVIASLEAASGPNVADAERPVAAIGEFFISACTSLPAALRGVVDDDTLDWYQQAGNVSAEWIRRVLDRLVPARVDAAVAELLGASIWQSSDESLVIPVAEEKMLEGLESARTDETSYVASQLAPPILRRVENRYGRSAWPVVAARLGALMYAKERTDILSKELLRLHRSGGLDEVFDGVTKVLGGDSASITKFREYIRSYAVAMDRWSGRPGADSGIAAEDVERLEEVLGPQSKEANAIRLMRLRGAFEREDYDAARDILKRAVDAEVAADTDQAGLNTSYDVLVKLLLHAKEHAEALRYAEAFVARIDAGHDDGMKPAEVATARQTIAYCLAMTGEVEKSLALYRELLEATEKEHGEKHPETTKLRLNVIALMNQTGREHEAYALHRRPRVEIERRTTNGLEPPAPATRKHPEAPQTKAAESSDASKTKDEKESEPPKAEEWKGFELPGVKVR